MRAVRAELREKNGGDGNGDLVIFNQMYVYKRRLVLGR